MRHIILFILLLSSLVEANSFDERIVNAKSELEKSSGVEYHKVTNEILYAKVPACFSKPGEITKGWFTLVATVSASGKATNIEAQPESRLSNCIVNFLKNSMLPVPPNNMFPIIFEVNIVP